MFKHEDSVRRLFLPLVLFASVAGACHAATVVWTAGGDGLTWSDPANWSTGVLPGAADDVVLPPGPAIMIPFPTTVAVRSVEAQRRIELGNWASLTCAALSHFTDLAIGPNAVVGAAAGAEVVITGLATSDYGTLGGPGRTIITGQYTSSTTLYVQGDVRNEGLIRFATAMNLSGCTLTNAPGAVLTSVVQAPGQTSLIGVSGGAPCGVINNGSIVSNSPGSWLWNVPITNNGAITITAGDASFSGSLALLGPLTIGTQATVTLAGPLSSPPGSNSLAGDGYLILAGATGDLAGAVTFHGRLGTQYNYTNVGFAAPVSLSALDPVYGTLRFAGAVSFPGPLRIASFGRVDLDASQSFASVTMADSSTLGGIGTVTILGSLACESATLTGPGPMIIEAGATATFSGSSVIGKPLINRGTIVPSRGLTFLTPTINEGIIEINVPDQQIIRISQSGLPPAAIGLTNAGEVRKTGPGRLVIDAVFRNIGLLDDREGPVEVQGTVNFTGRTLRAGSWRVAGSGSLEFPYHLLPSAPLLGLDTDAEGHPARLFIDGPTAVFDPNNQSAAGPSDTRWKLAYIGAGCEFGASGGARVTLWPDAVLVNEGQSQHFEATPLQVLGTLSCDSSSRARVPSWLNLTPSASVNITYGGPGPAPIEVLGAEFNSHCRLAGALRVRLAPGYSPPPGTPESVLIQHFFDPESACFATFDLPPEAIAFCTGDPVNAVLFAPRCVADFNGDGGVDGDDIIAFFAMWDSNNAAADANGDGGVDGDDVIVFFDHWDRNC